MNTPTYLELASASGKLSDDYYRQLIRWTTNGHGDELKHECRSIAGKYMDALEAQISYLHSIPLTREVDHAITIAGMYKELLEKDLKMLSSHEGCGQ
jgi:hypothetical protein